MSKHDQVLAGLVLSLQAATMQHLGKITNMATGKMERDLEQARGTIDILEMLKAKCRQETPPEILTLLDKTVMELQLNYLDEVKKEQAGDEAAAEESAAPDTEPDQEPESEADQAPAGSEDDGPGENQGTDQDQSKES
jgi:hypothetical protein